MEENLMHTSNGHCNSSQHCRREKNSFSQGKIADKSVRKEGLPKCPWTIQRQSLAAKASDTLASAIPFTDEEWDEQVDAIRRWLNLLVWEDGIIELRALRVLTEDNDELSTLVGFYDSEHLEELATEAVELTECAEGVYVTLNPLRQEILKRSPNRVQSAG